MEKLLEKNNENKTKTKHFLKKLLTQFFYWLFFEMSNRFLSAKLKLQVKQYKFNQNSFSLRMWVVKSPVIARFCGILRMLDMVIINKNYFIKIILLRNERKMAK